MGNLSRAAKIILAIAFLGAVSFFVFKDGQKLSLNFNLGQANRGAVSTVGQVANLQVSCGASEASLRWDTVPKATNYLLRIDYIDNNSAQAVDSWYVEGSEDRMLEVKENSYSYRFTPNKKYNWWVHANNAGGYGLASGGSFRCTGLVKLARPSNLKATCSADARSVKVSWDKVEDATNYLLRIDDRSNNSQKAQDGWYVEGSEDRMLEVNKSSYDGQISPGQTYSWWVHANNAGGYGDPGIDEFRCNLDIIPTPTPTSTPTASPVVTPQTSALSYFGFYHVNACWDDPFDVANKKDYTDEVAFFTNTAILITWCSGEDHNIVDEINGMYDQGVKPLLDINSVFYYYTGTGRNFDRYTDYAARWQEFLNTNRNVDWNKVAGFYLMDEPFWNGLTYDDVRLAAELIKNTPQTRNVPIAIVEAEPAVNATSFRIPTAIDWIGFDVYGIADPSTSPRFLGLLNRVKQARSAPGQRIILVMDSQWDSNIHGNFSEAGMASVAEKYYRLAASDPAVVALLGFIWPGIDNGGHVWKGARNLPTVVRNKYQEIGRSITGKSGVAVTTVPTTTPATPAPNTFYVSPSGNDNNPGTLGQPFRTLEKARDAVRAINDNMTRDITVYLRGGTYTLPRTFALTQEDSGTNGHNIIYRNHSSENPVISGGTRLTGWVREGNKWKVNVGTAVDTRQLYVNGTRATRARSTGGLSGAVETAVGYTTTNQAMQNWGNKQDIEMVQNMAWKQFRCGVERIAGSSITMQQPCWRNAQLHYDIDAGWDLTMGVPSWIENAYELLDQPGEWYLNRSTGWLYYIPRAGQNMTSAVAIIPTLETLISGVGSLNQPIQNIQFQGITFAYAGWTRPNDQDGFAEIQANLHLTGANAKIYDTPYWGATWSRMPGNISFRTAKNIRFENDAFVHLGGVGLDIGYGSQNNIIIGNRFTDISGTAITLGEVNNAKTNDARQLVKNNQITNNYIHNVAAEYQGGVGIWLGYTQNSLVAHNELTNLPYTAISIGWGWGNADPTVARENRITDNSIHDVMLTLDDGGGIYSLSSQPGNVYASNAIWNVVKGSGLYLDQKSRYITLENNISVNNMVGVATTGGNHIIRNNWWVNNTGQYANVLTNSGFGPNQVENNHTITSLSQAPAALINNAGIEVNYRAVKNRAISLGGEEISNSDQTASISEALKNSLSSIWQWLKRE